MMQLFLGFFLSFVYAETLREKTLSELNKSHVSAEDYLQENSRNEAIMRSLGLRRSQSMPDQYQIEQRAAAVQAAQTQLQLEMGPNIPIQKEIREIRSASEIPEIPENRSFEIVKFANQDIYQYVFRKKTDDTIFDLRLYRFIEAPGQQMLNDYQLYSSAKGLDALGSDYTVSDIVRFLNVAHEKKIKLNPWEIQLVEQLTYLKLIQKKADHFVMIKEAAILSVHNESPLDTKEHELNHGIYFTDPNYKARCDSLFDTLNENEKKLIFVIFNDFYEKGDRSLMGRELCAHLRNLPAVKKNFSTLFTDSDFAVLKGISNKVKSFDSSSVYYREKLRSETKLPLSNQ